MQRFRANPGRLHIIVLLLFSFSASAKENLDWQTDQIQIARDSFGVPHIFSPTDAQTAYGLAWAHAEDDFEQIQHAMLSARGKLGRVTGIDGVIFDYGLQFLQIDSIVDSRYDSDFSPHFKHFLQGYVSGLNAFAEVNKKQVIRKHIFPLEPKDVIKGYVLGNSLMAGLGMALKATREGKIEEYFNANDIGSNAIAVSPDKMADGKGYLLINSHQPLEGRFAWYEAHLQSDEGLNIIGGTFPGGVSIFLGTNEYLGWAHTTNYHNFGDIYELKINPKNKNQYQYDDKWIDFTTKKAKLVVKIAGIPIPVRRKLRFCRYGPVFKIKSGYYAFRFAGYTDIRAAEQWFLMNKAKNLPEFEDALRMEAIPLFNTIYADVEGNIFMRSGGRVPKRNPKLDWTYPIRSNSSAHRWTEIQPYEALPKLHNPPCGYLFNANNTALQASGENCNWKGYFPGLQRFRYNRGDQLDKKFAEIPGRFSEEQVNQIKFNSAYARGASYMAHFKPLFDLKAAEYPEIADAIDVIQSWNLEGGRDNVNAALPMIVHDILRKQADAPFALLMIRERSITELEAVDALKEAKKRMLKWYGTLTPRLGDVQRYIRGDLSMPADGLREVLRAADSKLVDKKNGIFKITGGDGYMQIIRFSAAGPEIRSIHQYGAAQHEDSPHYNDQLERFANGELRSVTLSKEEVLQKAIRIYNPGE